MSSRFHPSRWGLSIVWLLVMVGSAITAYTSEIAPTFYEDFSTIIKLVIISLAFTIFGLLALFYFDAYADVREGHPRPDVTVERFIFVIGIVALVSATSLGMLQRLTEPPSYRIPIILFAYLVIIYGLIKRQQHFNKPLFPSVTDGTSNEADRH